MLPAYVYAYAYAYAAWRVLTVPLPLSFPFVCAVSDSLFFLPSASACGVRWPAVSAQSCCFVRNHPAVAALDEMPCAPSSTTVPSERLAVSFCWLILAAQAVFGGCCLAEIVLGGGAAAHIENRL
ncbi:hypothetical protein HDU84_003121 [Entophlyctis sp. JEL0112]|nr:hypothetical protein HDU84_003121 [Entophlyctis sp. JEL0112]